MKVVYHPRYREVYASDPAAMSGRIEAALRELEGRVGFVEPGPATQADLRLVHSQSHIDSIKRNPHLYEVAVLAVGGALKAAELAMSGEPAFALVRPPGHHASSDSCWGFCFFNNIAIAVAKLMATSQIRRAFILDFDLHYGDGTDNTLTGPSASYFHPEAYDRGSFMEAIRRRLRSESGYDVLAISAGFDRHMDDWGGMLSTTDYHTIGELAGEAALRECHGRCFAVLEGGYNHSVLGKNVMAFLEGFDS